MDRLKINQYKSSFDAIAQYIENEQKEQVEIWFARELQSILGYARWENFVVALKRAVESCKTQRINVDDHFREVTKMVELGSGAKRKVEDYMRTVWLDWNDINGVINLYLSAIYLLLGDYSIVKKQRH